jgi:hypothetical protein
VAPAAEITAIAEIKGRKGQRITKQAYGTLNSVPPRV